MTLNIMGRSPNHILSRTAEAKGLLDRPRDPRRIVEDASAVTEELETNKDLEGLFTTEQAERVDARLQVRIEISDENGVVLAFTSTEATRSRTTPENVSLNERDQIYNDLTIAVMNDFNTSQEQGIRRHFDNYLN